MTEATNDELVSALVDDELDASEQDAAIGALLDDDDMRQRWQRYHVLGDVLRGHADAVADNRPQTPASATVVDLSARRASRAPLAGLAIAASVAVLAVALVLGRGPGVSTPGQPAGLEVAAKSEPRPLAPRPVESLKTSPVRQVAPVGAYDQRLNGYLVNFNEQRARLGVPGVHPYVRIVGFDAE